MTEFPDPRFPRRTALGLVGGAVAASSLGMPNAGPLAWASPAAAEDCTRSWHPGTPNVVLATAPDGKRYQFPNGERLDGDRIVAVAREGAIHTGQDGRLVMFTSEDLGRTWSPARVVHDSPLDDRDPMIARLSDGRLLLNWFEIDWNAEPWQVVGTFVAYSDDGGENWSKPVAVQSSLSGDSDQVDTYELGWNANHGQIKELPNGELIIPLYGTVPDDKWQRSVAVRSLDRGESWLLENESVIARESNSHYQEPVLTVLPDGRIHALLRMGVDALSGNTKLSRDSWSHDSGRTWSAPAELAVVTSSAHTELLPDGRVFLTYGDPSGRFTSFRASVGAVIDGEPGSWDAPMTDLVWDSGDGDQANPAAIGTGPDEVLVLGFDAPNRQLVGTFVRPSEFGRDCTKPGIVNLAELAEANQIEVITDLDYTDPERPGVHRLGAIDGVINYTNASWKNNNTPGFYELRFPRATRAIQVGLVLKPGHAASARVQASAGGQTTTVGTLDQRIRYGNEIDWFDLPSGVTSIRVDTEAVGWTTLCELLVRTPDGKL